MEIEVKRIPLSKTFYAVEVYIDGERMNSVTNASWELALHDAPLVTLTFRPDSFVFTDEAMGKTYKHGKE